MNIYRRYKLWFGISLALMAASVVFLAMGGLKFGIDFTGGSLLEIEFSGDRPTSEAIQTALADKDLGEIQVQPIGEKGMLLRLKVIDNATRNTMLGSLQLLGEVQEKRFEAIGPTIGADLRERAMTAIILVLVTIVIYISFAFRQVSAGPVRSWAYGIGAILALVHDILITTGVFAVLGYYQGVEVGSLFVTALLTILGFSVHDTIVVYDRIREMLRKNPGEPFLSVIERSVQSTIVRSINTSMTAFLVLLALFFFGGESVRHFVLALMIGVVVGTYSSIFIAPTLLLSWKRFRDRRVKT